MKTYTIKNGDHTDNQLENLEILSRSEHTRIHTRDIHRKHSRGESHYKSKLTERDVIAIRERYATGSVSQRGLAKAFCVSRRTIRNILEGNSWKHV